MATKTPLQYRVTKIRRVLDLVMTAASIQPRLNTEDRAIMVPVSFTVICEILPSRALITILITMRGLSM